MRVDGSLVTMSTNEVFWAEQGNCGEQAKEVATQIVTDHLITNKDALQVVIESRVTSLKDDFPSTWQMLKVAFRPRSQGYRENEMRTGLIGFNLGLIRKLKTEAFEDRRSGDRISADFIMLFGNDADSKGIDHALTGVKTEIQRSTALGLADFAISMAASPAINERHARVLTLEELSVAKTESEAGLTYQARTELKESDLEYASLCLEVERMGYLANALQNLVVAEQL